MSNIEICLQKSIDLLIKNSTNHGLLASSNSKTALNRNYLSIFGRDASICALGMALSNKKVLLSSALKSLDTLAKYQAPNGQIAFYIKPEKREVDFYYFGCIDSTLWWLIALKFIENNTEISLVKKYKKQINLALTWLSAQEHQQFFLLQQNEASDWADLMPRSGFVLYTNALWYWVKILYNLPQQANTKKYFNLLFSPNLKLAKKESLKNKRLSVLKKYLLSQKNNPCYLSFVNYSFAGQEIDVLGNILAGLLNICDRQRKIQIINYLQKNKTNFPYPTKAVLKPINKKNKLWRPYMEKHNNINTPYQYHNGGVWPFIGGFWVMLISQINKQMALKELTKLANSNAINNWQFNEWLHGVSGKPMGIAKQSWNAGTYLLAWQSIYKKIKLF